MDSENNTNKTLASLIERSEISVPDSLEARILACISKLERRALRIKLAILGSLSLLSLVGVVVSFFYLGRSLAQSGFNDYLSLIFSESAVLTVYWKEITLSLLESLPALSVAPLLIVIGIFIWSSSKTWTNARDMMRTA